MSEIWVMPDASLTAMTGFSASRSELDAAYREAVSAHYEALYRFALHLARNREEAEDLTQYAYLKLARKHRTLRDLSKVKSWLFSTLYRQFIDNCRKRGRYTGLPTEDLPSSEASPRHELSRKLEYERLHAALERIPESTRAPLLLFYMEDASYKEIADILGIPIGTVMSRLSRGKQQLYEQLSGDGTHPDSAQHTPI